MASVDMLIGQTTDPLRQLKTYYDNHFCDSFLALAIRLEKQGHIGPEDYYDARLDCYLRTYEYEPALRWVRTLARQTHNPRYIIDAAYLYQRMGQTSKAKHLIQKLLRGDYASPATVRYVGNYLMQRDFPEEALQLFEQARQQLNDPFCEERGRILHRLERWEDSWKAWFECADTNLAIRHRWQAFIQDHLLSNHALVTPLKGFLIRHAHQGSITAEDLLAWIYLQEGNYRSALRHYQALDRRLGEQGRRVLPLAHAAAAEGFDQIAQAAYNYILSLGPQSPHYSEAFLGHLRIQYRQVSRPDVPLDSVRFLANILRKAIDNPRYRNQRLELLQMWSTLRGIYLKEVGPVFQFFDHQLQSSHLRPDERGELLLMKGNFLVQANRLWDAWLAYSRAEKEHKGTIADRARLRKAWLSFYMGNFDYALLFTDVLKGGTDKYVANDAIALELLIKDHRNLLSDTSSDLLHRFAHAHLAFQQHRYQTAKTIADSILDLFPSEMMRASAIFLQARSHEALGQLDSALQAYQIVFTQHPQHILADDALYHAARLLDIQLHRTEQALPLYEKLIFEYSGSVFTAEIRKRFRELRQHKPPSSPRP